MPREFAPVVTTEEKGAGNDGEMVQRHPAFVQVSFSRTTGSYKLYGSALPKHDGAVVLTVVESDQHHTLGRDWHMGHGRQKIEVAMSAAQFAEAITTMNVASGVCGTLQVFDGLPVPQIPFEHETESTRVIDAFKEKVAKSVRQLSNAAKEAREILAKKSLTQDDRKKIMYALDRAVMEIGSNAPFYVESFEEAAEKVVTSAKAEVEAFVTGAVHRAGLAALADGIKVPALARGVAGDRCEVGNECGRTGCPECQQ